MYISYNNTCKEVTSRKGVDKMKIQTYFHVNRFRNLVLREGLLKKADIETCSDIDSELNHCNYVNDQGEQLKKVALLVGKYSDKDLSTKDIANMILWNCIDTYVLD